MEEKVKKVHGDVILIYGLSIIASIFALVVILIAIGSAAFATIIGISNEVIMEKEEPTTVVAIIVDKEVHTRVTRGTVLNKSTVETYRFTLQLPDGTEVSEKVPYDTFELLSVGDTVEVDVWTGYGGVPLIELR